MRRAQLQIPRVQQDFIPLDGGLDLVSGPWSARPGTLRQAQNFEIDINGGYRDIEGYERFDGRPRPSDAAYVVLPTPDGHFAQTGDLVGIKTFGFDASVEGWVASTSGTLTWQSDGTVLWERAGSSNGSLIIFPAEFGASFPGADAVIVSMRIRRVSGTASLPNILRPALAEHSGYSSARQKTVSAVPDNLDEWNVVVWNMTTMEGAGGPDTWIDGNVTGLQLAGNDNSAAEWEIDWITINPASVGANAVIIGVTAEHIALTGMTPGFTDPVLYVEGDAVPVDGASGAGDSRLAAEYAALAANVARAAIGPVPGSGAVRGVFQYNDSVYAWRNNEGVTAAHLFVATPDGWEQVPLGRELAFSQGDTFIPDGATITGATSGATAVVGRQVVEGGSLLGGDAEGRLILLSQIGTFSAENIEVSAAVVAQISGDSTAISMQPSGTFEIITHNFGQGNRVYGVDRVNRGWEFDGTAFVPINTGMTIDAPTHVAGFRNHLFYSFGPSLQHSAIADQYSWQPLLGAGELNIGDDINGIMQEPGSEGNAALGVYSKNSIHILYGTSASDWNLVPYRREVGARAGTIQQMAMTVFLDDRGLTTLQTSDVFGNFAHSAFSNQILPLITEKRALATCSCIVRNKNQYRIFFSDGSALYVTTNGRKITGIMPQLFPTTVRCIDSQETANGDEEMYFGGDDGYLYQLDSGMSFDGAEIEAYFMTHFHASKSLRWIKKYLACTLEAEGKEYARFNFSYELGHASTDIEQPPGAEVELPFAEVFWDNFVWDAFTWDTRTLSPTDVKLSGSAENISLIIRKQSRYYAPIRFTNALITFTQRRMLR